MKKMMILAVMMVMTISANAMSYNAAKNEALFLSDKMAYELNLTAAQYEAVYEINLDYLMSLNGHGDTFAVYSHYNRGHFYNDRPRVYVTYKGGNNRREVRFYADRKVTKPTVHHAPAPHHPKAPVNVGKRNGFSNHTLANNTPRHGHSNAGHFGRR